MDLELLTKGFPFGNKPNGSDQPFFSLASVIKPNKSRGPRKFFTWGMGEDLILRVKSSLVVKKLSGSKNTHLLEVLRGELIMTLNEKKKKKKKKTYLEHLFNPFLYTNFTAD